MNFKIQLLTGILVLTGCVATSQQTYQDKFPEPCSKKWFIEVEQQVNLIDQNTGRPPAGSPQWLAALDEKYTISDNTSTEIGDLEWCHQVHQLLIGL